MRRSSLVTPLLLIGVGALLLARTLHPELPLMDYVARYWPFALIGWGALRAAEILYWAPVSKPQPARGISGATGWFLCWCACSARACTPAAHWTEGPFGNLEIFGGQTFDYRSRGKSHPPTPRGARQFPRRRAAHRSDAATVQYRAIHSFDQRGADAGPGFTARNRGRLNRVVLGIGRWAAEAGHRNGGDRRAQGRQRRGARAQWKRADFKHPGSGQFERPGSGHRPSGH